MAGFDMSKLVQRGLDATDDRWEPPAGEKLVVKVAKANASVQDDGLPKWGAMFEVLQGEHKGKTFWFNIRFSQEWDFINKEAVDSFAALGVTPQFLASNPEPSVVAAMLEGKTTIVVTGYRTNKKTAKTYPAHKLEARKVGAPPPPSAVIDDDDEDTY